MKGFRQVQYENTDDNQARRARELYNEQYQEIKDETLCRFIQLLESQLATLKK